MTPLGNRISLSFIRSALLVGLLLIAVACSPVVQGVDQPPKLRPGPTGISGKVVDRHGAVAADVYVYAYRNTRSQLRGPADFAARVNPDGSYFLDLVEGRYYLVARQRQGRADSGPPRAGDAWSLYIDNPVKVMPGHTSHADFRLQSLGRPLAQGKGISDTSTRLTGTVVDSAGEVVVGATVMAYQDADLKRMPDFASPPTDESGRFSLPVAGAGSYCLAARTRSRGQPQPGEPYGIYQAADGSPCVKVGEGVTDVGRIVLRPYRQ